MAVQMAAEMRSDFTDTNILASSGADFCGSKLAEKLARPFSRVILCP